jgi:hypothetical protein
MKSFSQNTGRMPSLYLPFFSQAELAQQIPIFLGKSFVKTQSKSKIKNPVS